MGSKLQKEILLGPPPNAVLVFLNFEKFFPERFTSLQRIVNTQAHFINLNKYAAYT